MEVRNNNKFEATLKGEKKNGKVEETSKAM